MAHEGTLYVTFVDKEGPYLKIWGQTDRNVPVGIEKALEQMKGQFEQGHFLPHLGEFTMGKLLAAKFKDGNYYRAKVTNTNFLQQGIVEVQFVDYGNKEFIQCLYTRTIPAASQLVAVEPQAREFILANITHPRIVWEDAFFQMISSELRYLEFDYKILYTVGPYSVIKLFRNNEDVSLLLVNLGYAIHVTSETQSMILYGSRGSVGHSPTSGQFNIPPPGYPPAIKPPMNSPPPPLNPGTTPTIINFKSTPLEPGSEHPCYVSYITDGPGLFSIQLQKHEEMLRKLMTDVNNLNLQYLEEVPIPGAVCLAKTNDDNFICRAVVTNMVDNKFKVFYVDFGNTEELSLERLYQIPFKYVIPKVMSIRFALAGLENVVVSLEMKCAFKDFVNNKLMYMRVVPMEPRAPLPMCELWDEDGRNVLEVLKSVALESYPDPLSLSRGTHEIKVCSVYSCNRFYVQLKSKEEELCELMKNLQEKSKDLLPYPKEYLTPGRTCISLYEDQQWYRAQIIEVDQDLIRVKYVDYGNDEFVPINRLKLPEPDYIIKLRPQALECSLNGYQNMEPDAERDGLLEQLIVEKDFSMKVVEVQDYRAIVDLIDANHYNVNSLLFDKIAATKAQVSQIIVQDNHRIEHRRKTNYQQHYEHDQKSRKSSFSSRDSNDNDWGSKKTPPESWRQSNKNLKEANENDQWNNKKIEMSWRQNKPQRSDEINNKKFSDTEKSPDFYKNKRNEDRAERNLGERSKSFGDKSGFKNKGDRKFGDRPDKFRDRGDRSDKFGVDRSNFGRQANAYVGDRKKFGKPPGFKSKDGKLTRGSKPFASKTNEYSTDKTDSNSDKWDSARETPQKLEAPKFVSPPVVLDIVSPKATFLADDISGCTEPVKICWFHNPEIFFVQRDSTQGAFKVMMEEIQSTYANVKPLQDVVVGMPVISQFADDKVMYRALVLEVNLPEYSIIYVDFGNRCKVNKVWPMDKRFMSLPRQAYCCGLSSVSPVDDVWPTPEQFSHFFNKDGFICKFLALDMYEPGKFIVELTHNGNNVVQELEDAGLLIYHRPPEPIELDMSLLVGQQFRAVLGEFESLNEFTMYLEPGLPVKCSMHNLSSATEKDEELLLQCLGHQLIMYIDKYEDKNLEVTIYDQEGFKLEIISPDDGSYESVDVLCPMPVFNNKLTGYVTHVTENSVFVQPHRTSNMVDVLLERLYAMCQSSVVDSPVIPDVDVVYGAHSSDGNWYRGRVKQIDEKQVTIQFVDYGNTEVVTIDDLRQLTGDFYELHVLALEVLTPEANASMLDQEVNITLKYGEKRWEAESISLMEPTAQPSTIGTATISDTETLTEDINIIEAETDKEEVAVEPEVPPVQKGISVTVSHVDSPSEFYLQTSDAVEEIENLQKILQEQVEQLPVLENPVTGVLCAAPYTVNQLYYRAQILDAFDDICSVRFVDYGNTDLVKNGTASLRTLPAELLALTHHARRTSLMCKPNGSEWSPTAATRFEELIKAGCVTAEIVYQDEKVTYVDLFANGVDVGSTLINEGLAVQLQVASESSSTGYVSHYNSPSEFWIQLDNSVGDLEWVADQLVGAESYPELQDLTPGSLCAAIFSEDESWYRARILSNTVAGLEVLFIDYGNSLTCTTVRELPEDLIMLPPLAVKCSLQKPPGVLQWSPQATEKFKEISQDGAAAFSVRKITPGETSIVQLTLNEKDISEQLLPITVNGSIVHYGSIDSFWVQKSEVIDTLEHVSEALQEAGNWPEKNPVKVGDVVAALCKEKKVWYRAKVLAIKEGEFYVQLIDYGNVVIALDVRELGNKLEDIEGLAIRCKLDMLPGYRWPDDINKNLITINNDGATKFQIEFVSDNVVRLYLNNRDIRADLGCIKCSPLVSLHSTPAKLAAVRDEAKAEIVDDVMTVIQKHFQNNETSQANSGASEKVIVGVEGILNRIETDLLDKIKEIEKEKVTESITVAIGNKELADHVDQPQSSESSDEDCDDIVRTTLSDIVDNCVNVLQGMGKKEAENNKNLLMDGESSEKNEDQEEQKKNTDSTCEDKSEDLTKTSDEDNLEKHVVENTEQTTELKEDLDEKDLEIEVQSKKQPDTQSEATTEEVQNDIKIEVQSEGQIEEQKEGKIEEQNEREIEEQNEGKIEEQNATKTEEQNATKAEEQNETKTEEQNATKAEEQNGTKTEEQAEQNSATTSPDAQPVGGDTSEESKCENKVAVKIQQEVQDVKNEKVTGINNLICSENIRSEDLIDNETVPPEMSMVTPAVSPKKSLPPSPRKDNGSAKSNEVESPSKSPEQLQEPDVKKELQN